MSKRCEDCGRWSNLPNWPSDIKFSNSDFVCDECFDRTESQERVIDCFRPVNFNNACELCQAEDVHTNIMDICRTCHDGLEDEYDLELTLKFNHHVYQFGDWRPDRTPIGEIERGLHDLRWGQDSKLSIRECQEIDPSHPYGQVEYDL